MTWRRIYVKASSSKCFHVARKPQRNGVSSFPEFHERNAKPAMDICAARATVAAGEPVRP
jgi:hypothetical protein